MDLCAVVMAAGESRRMKSKRCKFVQTTAGKPIILWIKEALEEAGAREQVYIVGHMQEQVRQVLGEEVAFMLQERQLGTAHAVMQASPFLEGRRGMTLVVRGDTPLLTGRTLREVIRYFQEGDYAAVIVTASTTEPTGYGRIVRDGRGDVAAVLTGGRERKGAMEGAEKGESGSRVFEGNSSIYCFDTALLVSALGRIGSKADLPEYCLTDAIGLLLEDGRKVGAYRAPYEETIGVQDKYQLMQVSKLLNRRICRSHMLQGVTILDPDTTWIEASVTIRPDAEILPNTIIEGSTVIGENAVIGPDARISDSVIGDEAIVYNSIVSASTIREGACIGPYSYIRQNSDVGPHARIGHAVEVRNSNVGAYGKALNMGLIADADMGENVSYGCGSITVNFDGNIKNRTKIGENSFIGSNTNLVAPVQVADNAYVAAGSTITDDVPAFGMAIARSRQTVKEDWVLKKNRVRLQERIEL